MYSKRTEEFSNILHTEHQGIKINATHNEKCLENKIIHTKQINNSGIISTKSGVFHQVLVTCSILLCAAACGMPIGYSAVLLPQLYNSSEPLNIDIEMGSWIASIHSLATPFGSFISGPIADKYGRRPTLFLAITPLIIGWILIALSQSHMMILLGRIMAGIAVGLTGPPAQILLAEVAEPHIRGILIGAPFVSYSMGILIVYALGSSFHWRVAAWCCIIVPLMAAISVLLIPESPVWLVRHNKMKKASKTLLWVRGNEKVAENELEQLVQRFENEKHARDSQTDNFLRTLFKTSSMKPLLIINGFNLLVIFSGTYLIVFYAIDIINQFGTEIDNMKAAVATAIVRLLCTLIFCFLLLKINRRILIIFSGLGSGLTCSILGLYLFIKSKGADKGLLHTYFVLFLILTYLCFNTSFMMMPGIMIGELLPTKIRAQIAGYLFALSHVLTFGLTKIFPYITFKLKIHGLFFMFGFCSILCSLFMFLLLPETKNSSLGDIEDYFNRKNWFWFNRNKIRKTKINNITE